jgi:hypothetical protein
LLSLSCSHESPGSRGTRFRKSWYVASPSKVWRFLCLPPGVTLKNATWCLFCVECFVRISEETATFALNSFNWLVFITVVESVYCAVWTDPLYKAD